MANQKVSDLPSLNGADVDAADLLYIIDSSAGSAGSKKITVGQYQLAPVSGGTANGVAYLDASKVLTTGSALTFDGTNLGIGTSSPGARLQVKSNGQTAIFEGTTARGGGNIYAAFNDPTGRKGYWGYGGGDDAFYLANEMNAPMLFITNSTERMRLDASGNLGIGTSSPQTKLNISDATAATVRVTCTGGSGTNLDLTSTSTQVQVGSPNGVPLLFLTTATERARIDSSGNFLVGLSSPTFVSTRTEVQAATNNNALGAKTTQNNYAPLMAWNSATTGDNLFQYFYTEGTLTLRGSIDYNRAGGLVRYNTTSDYRAKDIIGPVQNSGATIDALKVYEGKMKGATQSRPMLIAHEAQEHAPYAVSGVKDEVNEDGTPKFQQMDVSSLVPLLLAEIQSLRARVAALESA